VEPDGRDKEPRDVWAGRGSVAIFGVRRPRGNRKTIARAPVGNPSLDDGGGYMRRTWTLVLALLIAGPALAAQEVPGPGEVVEALFVAMKAGDADAMQALMHPDVRLISTSVRDGAPVAQVVAVDRWLQGVRASTRELDERIYDTQVLRDEGLASVWTRYDLFVDGAFSHCGVDHVLLVRTSDGWRIVEISDTRSTEGCRGA